MPATATRAQIRRAFLDKARLFHPDAHADGPEPMRLHAERMMRDLNVAWGVLREPRRRADYDERLAHRHSAVAVARRVPPSRPLAAAGIRTWLGAVGMPRATGDPAISVAIEAGADLAALRELAPNGVWAIHAAGSDVDDDALAHLAGLTGLRVLDLSGTRVTDVGLLHLHNLTNLETLLLWDTAVTDAGLRLVGHLLGLRHLGLGNTRVSDRGLAHLAALGGLRVLQLWGTKVRGPGLTWIQGLSALEVVTLPWRVRGGHRRQLRDVLSTATIA